MLRIFVNGQPVEVYENQTVLQALLQVDEPVKHSCQSASRVHVRGKDRSCSIEIEVVGGKRYFKACLAPIKAGMNISIRGDHE